MQLMQVVHHADMAIYQHTNRELQPCLAVRCMYTIPYHTIRQYHCNKARHYYYYQYRYIRNGGGEVR